jgi:adenylyl- and sulfurtransferase ThiI
MMTTRKIGNLKRFLTIGNIEIANTEDQCLKFEKAHTVTKVNLVEVVQAEKW